MFWLNELKDDQNMKYLSKKSANLDKKKAACFQTAF